MLAERCKREFPRLSRQGMWVPQVLFQDHNLADTERDLFLSLLSHAQNTAPSKPCSCHPHRGKRTPRRFANGRYMLSNMVDRLRLMRPLSTRLYVKLETHNPSKILKHSTVMLLDWLPLWLAMASPNAAVQASVMHLNMSSFPRHFLIVPRASSR